MKVLGKNVVIFIQVGTDWVLYACATSATLNVVTDVIETSVSGNGKFKSYLPTANSFTGTLEGVTSFETDGKLSLQDLRQRQLAQELLMMKFQRSDETGNLYTDQASFYITSSSDVGSFNDMNNFTIELQGTGILSLAPYEPVIPVPFDFYYGQTDFNVISTGVGGVNPIESEYVSAVDNTFGAGGELAGSEPNTGNYITIGNFGNSDDEVLFLQVAASEAPFTRWSEIGNPLQQNQPIDSAFDFGSGAVWFKTTRDGQSLYVTYYQTTFAGPIIFSR